MLKRFSTRIRATFVSSGTLASRSSPDNAGTGAFFAGSIFMAIVPPVAIMWQTGGACAASVPSAKRTSRNASDTRGSASELTVLDTSSALRYGVLVDTRRVAGAQLLRQSQR